MAKSNDEPKIQHIPQTEDDERLGRQSSVLKQADIQSTNTPNNATENSDKESAVQHDNQTSANPSCSKSAQSKATDLAEKAAGESTGLHETHGDGGEPWCSRCAEEGKTAPAHVQCAACVKNYCVTCAVQHDRLTSGHPVIGKENLPSWRQIDVTVITKRLEDVSVKPRVQKFKVRSKKDAKECSITDICRMSSGQHVVIDYSNRNAKLLGDGFKILSRHEFKSWPRCVAVTAQEEVSVTVGELDKPGEVHILGTGNGKLKLIKKMKMEHFCHGIAHFDKYTYIASRDALYKYIMKDQLIGKIYEDAPCGPYSFSVNKICVTGNGEKLYVSDWRHNRLVVLDNQGETRQTFVPDDDILSGTSGVAVTSDERVYLCGFSTKNVMEVFSGCAEDMRLVAGEADGIQSPNALIADDLRKTLTVVQSNDFLYVIRL